MPEPTSVDHLSDPGNVSDAVACRFRASCPPVADCSQVMKELRAGARGPQHDSCEYMAVQILCCPLGGYAEPAFWVAHPDFVARFVRREPAAGSGGDVASARVLWEEAVAAVDADDLDVPPVQRRIMRLAASLAVGTPVSLRDCIRPASVGTHSMRELLIEEAIREEDEAR